jgi:MSHA pilin protein MshD
MSTTDLRPLCPVRQRGVTLVELIIFIVIISIALAGVLLVINNTTRRSADPQVRKQALEIAESLLEEIEMAKFTYCSPTDTQGAYATTTAGPPWTVGPNPVGSSSTNVAGHCTSAALVKNFPPSLSGSRPYGNVIDYTTGLGSVTTYSTAGGTLSYAYTATNPPFAGNFTATVTINNGTALGGTAYSDPGANPNVPGALLITVTVSYPQGSVVLDGYRTQYAPQLMP